jgi:hypothetical protein
MEVGSLRNSAHDEEFFHVFEQYLDEAIKKLKEQGLADDYGEGGSPEEEGAEEL